MSLSQKITDKLVELQIVNIEEKGLYTYGFHQGFILILNTITVLVIGAIFNMIWQSVVFTVAYGFLRIYAGGYHADTQLRCYLVSLGMITAVLWLMKLIIWSGFVYFILTVTSSTIILLLAPVEDSNKPLEQKEKVVYKKRTNIILIVLVGVALFLWLTGLKQPSICIMIAILIISIMLVLGKIKITNDWRRNRSDQSLE